MPSRAEQQAPPPPLIPGLAWPGANDEPSGAEQSQVEAQCSGCSNPAVPGATRCQHCIDHNPPQNYSQLKERYPELPVQRLGEARRFA